LNSPCCETPKNAITEGDKKERKTEGKKAALSVIRPDFVLNGFLSVGFQTDRKS
jgi:hypothetical protein